MAKSNKKGGYTLSHTDEGLELQQLQDFELDSAINAILYIIDNVNKIDNANNATLHSISKLLYFADLHHLENMGRFIVGDSYIAREYGPVPDDIYKLFCAIRDHRPGIVDRAIYTKFNDALEVYDKYKVRAKLPVDTRYLSNSDLESLDYSIAEHGHKSFNELTEESHDDAWHAVPQDDPMRIIDIVNMFDNNEDLIDYLRNPHPDFEDLPA